VIPLVRRRALALAAATPVLALAPAGCGSDDDTSSPTARTPTTPPATTTESGEAAFTVTEREYSLTPADPELPSAGEFTISVRNAGATQHALEVEGPAGEVESGTIQPGKTTQLKVKLTKPGRYEWYCPIDDHKGKGMRGTIVVAGGSSAGGGSGKDDSDDRRRNRGRDSGGGNSGSGGSGRNDDSPRDDSMGSEGDSGGIGPSNDSGYGPG
jgi:plastocyanin